MQFDVKIPTDQYLFYFQYLRELPEPVLTDNLMPKFEQVSANSNPQKRIEGMKMLIASLPEANRTLLNWIFVHMGHVIERERFNKMTIQNVSIVLSPTMRISHRVLNCFFENSHILFDANNFKKYKPPIIGGGSGMLYTVWKFQDFSVIQILCEINFGALNFVDLVNFKK